MEIKFIKTKNLGEILRLQPILRKTFSDLREKTKISYLKERISKKKGMVLKMLIEGKLAGFSVWFGEEKKSAYIWWLVILPKWQKNGFGKKLLKMTLKEIKNMGFKRVWAKVKNDNFATLGLLAKFHFSITGLKEENGVFTLIAEKNFK